MVKINSLILGLIFTVISVLCFWHIGSTANITSIGFNWVANYAANPGETPQSALAKIGGTHYRDYTNPFSGDTDRARIRLVRYPDVYQISNGRYGSVYQLGNEPNLLEQDGRNNGLRAQQYAEAYATWHHNMVIAIRSRDPLARIIGPGVWNWNGAGSTCCVTGAQAYQWFVDAHQRKYGRPPVMNYIAVQVYPWSATYWNNPDSAVDVGLAQIDGAQAWSAGRWPVMVTEWGMLRKRFSCTLDPQQTENERYLYTKGMLDGMVARGVPLSLYYASHEQQCDSNGWMSWLINRDGSLTVEGQAHR